MWEGLVAFLVPDRQHNTRTVHSTHRPDAHAHAQAQAHPEDAMLTVQDHGVCVAQHCTATVR
jgi:hypothetical protein